MPNQFDILLKGSAEAHGHLCPGQVIGVRMALLGCELIGLKDPKDSPQIKKIVVYVEIDRCATDAISYVTGVTLGRRSLKFIDSGIMAATFVNLASGRAFRIVARESARELAAKYAPEEENPLKRQLAAYQIMPPEVLFQIEEVRVAVPESDLPGPTKFKAVCEDCQMVVRDKKEIRRNGRILCRACALGTYYDTLA